LIIRLRRIKEGAFAERNNRVDFFDNSEEYTASTLKIEVACFCEVVSTYKTTRCHKATFSAVTNVKASGVIFSFVEREWFHLNFEDGGSMPSETTVCAYKALQGHNAEDQSGN
jgi:hypothetical protein